MHNIITQIFGSGIEFGLLNCLFILGIAFAFRFGNFPDLTVEGSLILGAAVSAISIKNGAPPTISLMIGLLAGMLSGILTVTIHIKTMMSRLLSGIISMTILYALSLRLMQGSNLPLFEHITWFNTNNTWISRIGTISLIVIPIFIILYLFLKTEFGLLLRANAENEELLSKMNRPCVLYLYTSLAISNGLAGLSGALITNYNKFADVGFGQGAIIPGLAALLIGEALIRPKTVLRQVIACLVGAIAYYLVYAIALRIGLHPWDLKLVSALFVIITILISKRVDINRSFIHVGSDPL